MNPLEALDPTIIMQLRHMEQPHPVERAKYRGKITNEVKGCTNCELHKSCTAPVPFRGPKKPRIIVMGEAPGPEEDKAGKPFVGPSGKLLAALLRDAGFDPLEDVFYMNAVSCFPNVEGKIKAPSPNEMLACRWNMIFQMQAAYTPFVVLVGGKALHTFRSDLTVTNHRGQIFVMNDSYVVMPTYHPAFALRGNSAAKGMIREDLMKMAAILESGDDPLSFIGEKCFKCNGEATRWDRDAVPMCESHWKKWGKSWESERYRWTGDPIIQLTF